VRRFVFLLALFAVDDARAAGGAFAVDDAAVDAAGRCKIETWFSAANNPVTDWTAAVAPTCVAPLFAHRFEIGAAFQRASAAGEHGNSLTVKTKTPLPLLDFLSNDRFGVALVWGGSFDAANGQSHTMFVSAPLTIRIAESLIVNFSAGYHEDRIERYNAVTWGAGIELNLGPISLEKFTLIAEAFSNHRDHTATQIGLRFTPLERLDIDVIYGHNLASEEASWLTLGMNFRF
jgi:hypothetical protein